MRTTQGWSRGWEWTCPHITAPHPRELIASWCGRSPQKWADLTPDLLWPEKVSPTHSGQSHTPPHFYPNALNGLRRHTAPETAPRALDPGAVPQKPALGLSPLPAGLQAHGRVSVYARVSRQQHALRGAGGTGPFPWTAWQEEGGRRREAGGGLRGL